MKTRPIGTTAADQRKKYEAHRAANAAVKQLRSTKQYFTAFIVAFALLEDRVRALDHLGRAIGRVPSPKKPRRWYDWKVIVVRLHSVELIDHDLRTELLNLANIRNKVVHSALYNLAGVKETHVSRIVTAQRAMAKLVKSLSKSSSSGNL